MMMGAMDVPVAMACVVEQADVAVDVVAAEQEPAERRSLPRAGEAPDGSRARQQEA